MKFFAITGFKDGGLVFSFTINCYNSFQAIQLASDDELVLNMEFDRLVMKELKE